MHLRCASRDVDGLHVGRVLEDAQHLRDRLLVHHLLAARARLNVAVRARLVAVQPDVELQDGHLLLW
eukprot:scaffold38078_cov36-Phaeocystis_antarctica.AAC.1